MTVVIREIRRGCLIGCISKPTQNMPPLVGTRETERNVLRLLNAEPRQRERDLGRDRFDSAG